MEYKNSLALQRVSTLTPRELEVAELLAWGASKKEIPILLHVQPGRKPISVHTVENITTSIFSKLKIQKVSELCVVYFCTRFNISMTLSPIKRGILVITFLLLLTPEILSMSDTQRTNTSIRIVSTRGRSSVRRSSKEYYYGFE